MSFPLTWPWGCTDETAKILNIAKRIKIITMKIQFLKAVNRFEKLICSEVVLGKGTGWHVDLSFVEPGNFHQSRKDHTYGLFLQECSWRVESDSEVICSSLSSNEKNGEMVLGVKKLINDVLIGIECLQPSYDLILKFKSGLILKTFCYFKTVDYDFENYSLFVPGKVYTITDTGEIKIEDRQTKERN